MVSPDSKPTIGHQTSEYGLASWLIWIAGLLDVFAIILETLHGAGALPEKPWVATVLALSATVMAGIQGLGYQRSRTVLKVAAMQEDTRRLLGEAVPLAKRLVGTVSASRPPTVSPLTPPSVASPPSSSG